MVRFVFAWIVAGQASVVSAAQMQSPTTVQPCRVAEVTVATSTPTVRVGTRPEFSVVVANKSHRSMRVLDVRNGRRKDLQDAYFALLILEGRQLVELSSVISDLGPISDTDYAVLNPGERIEVRPLSYTRSAERLPPGKYSAVVLFWQNPETPASRCRSSDRSALACPSEMAPVARCCLISFGSPRMRRKFAPAGSALTWSVRVWKVRAASGVLFGMPA